MNIYKVYTSTGHGFEGPVPLNTRIEMLDYMDNLIFNQKFNGRIIVVKYNKEADQDILEYEYLGNELSYALFKRRQLLSMQSEQYAETFGRKR